MRNIYIEALAVDDGLLCLSLLLWFDFVLFLGTLGDDQLMTSLMNNARAYYRSRSTISETSQLRGFKPSRLMSHV